MTVYVMRSEAGPVKIGITSNLRTRLASVRCGSPYPVDVAHARETENDRRVEWLAHKILSDARLNGEWFNVSLDEALDAIDRAVSLLRDDTPCCIGHDYIPEGVTTPADLRAARKALGLTQSALAKALRLSPKNGDRSVRIWETDGNTIPGPVQVAIELLLNCHPASKSRNIPEQAKNPVTKPAGKAAK